MLKAMQIKIKMISAIPTLSLWSRSSKMFDSGSIITPAKNTKNSLIRFTMFNHFPLNGLIPEIVNIMPRESNNQITTCAAYSWYKKTNTNASKSRLAKKKIGNNKARDLPRSRLMTLASHPNC